VFLVNLFRLILQSLRGGALMCSWIGLHDVGITLQPLRLFALSLRTQEKWYQVFQLSHCTHIMSCPGLFCKHRIPKHHLPVEAFLRDREIDFGCELLCLLGENLFAFASYAPTHSLSWQKGNPWNQIIVLIFLVIFTTKH